MRLLEGGKGQEHHAGVDQRYEGGRVQYRAACDCGWVFPDWMEGESGKVLAAFARELHLSGMWL